MTEKMKKEILMAATTTSGLNGLSTIDINKPGIELPKNKWINALNVENTPKGYVVSLAIIIDIEVRSKIVSYEISSTIKDLFKKKKLKLSKVNIYIRGIK
ncbi:MAG: hypothetical protein HRT99_02775 [Mycoplasmatales bacterium]|nr:hypothetical protein [Mycoplasmatales bacterium]